MPAALAVLELDPRGFSRNTLFCCDPAGRGQRMRLVAKRLREHTVQRICPAAIVLDDLVVDVCHPDPSLRPPQQMGRTPGFTCPYIPERCNGHAMARAPDHGAQVRPRSDP